MATFTFPQAEELKEIEQITLPKLQTQRSIFDIMPVRTEDANVVTWEQEDDYVGLQQVRGLDGKPPRVARVGAASYTYQPGVYGEFLQLSESELTAGRVLGTFSEPINIDKKVIKLQEQLLQRELDLQEYIGWTLLATGTFSIAGPNGAVLHTDTYTLQTQAANTVWSTAASAKPLFDFRVCRLLGRGNGVSFAGDAKAYMNQAVFDELIANTNSNDLFGRRTQGLATIGSLKDINTVLAEENLPQIVIYDGGYKTGQAANTFAPYLPADKVVIVGKRPGGTPIMEYLLTRNASNVNAAPGSYTHVKQLQDPTIVEVHRGHNGGPAVYFPSAVVILSV